MERICLEAGICTHGIEDLDDDAACSRLSFLIKRASREISKF